MIKFLRRDTAANCRLVIEGSEFTAPIKPGQTLLEAAVTARIKFPNMCNVGECGTCRCRVREGKVRLKRDITQHVAIEEIEQGYVLGCQAVAESDVVVQVPGLSSTWDSFTSCEGTITALTRKTHDILQVCIELDQRIHYLAGQYARLSTPEVPGLADSARNYSFADAAGVTGTTCVTFFIRHVPGGLFTDWLFAADRTGATLNLAAPFGDFHYHASLRPLLCMAGGSGLAPVKALLEQMQIELVARPVTLLFGARAQRDLYCLAEIADLAAGWPAPFEFHPILSHEAESSEWAGARGFVTEHMERLVPGLSDREVYMCGPPVMLDAVLARLDGHVPPERIHFDRFLDQGSLASLTAAQPRDVA